MSELRESLNGAIWNVIKRLISYKGMGYNNYRN